MTADRRNYHHKGTEAQRRLARAKASPLSEEKHHGGSTLRSDDQGFSNIRLRCACEVETAGGACEFASTSSCIDKLGDESRACTRYRKNWRHSLSKSPHLGERERPPAERECRCSRLPLECSLRAESIRPRRLGSTALATGRVERLRDQSVAVCDAVGLGRRRDDAQAAGLESLRQMVMAGIGIALVPELATRAPFGASQLAVYRRFAPPPCAADGDRLP